MTHENILPPAGRMANQGRVLAPFNLLIATHALSMDAVLEKNDQVIKQMARLHIEGCAE